MSALLNRNAATAYSQVAIETSVEAADPHRLIAMLFEGGIKACKQAIIAMDNGDIPTKGALIGKAMDIILLGLKAGLNMEAGGELSQNLAALYDHLTYQLFLANAENRPEKIQAVIGHLEGLKDAWDQVPELLKKEGESAAAAPATATGAATPGAAVPAAPGAAASAAPAAIGLAGRAAKLYGSV